MANLMKRPQKNPAGFDSAWDNADNSSSGSYSSAGVRPYATWSAARKMEPSLQELEIPEKIRLKKRIESLDKIILAAPQQDFGDIAAAVAERRKLNADLAALNKEEGKQLDCTVYVMDVLGEAFEQQGKGALWRKILKRVNQSSMRRPDGKMSGVDILTALQTELGWKAVFWAPDPTFDYAHDGDKTEHRAAYEIAKKKGTYYGVKIDPTKMVTNYRPQDDNTKRQDPNIFRLRSVPFGIVAARGGVHMACLVRGRIYENHGSGTQIDSQNTLGNWDYLSGVLLAPPEGIDQAWQGPIPATPPDAVSIARSRVASNMSEGNAYNRRPIDRDTDAEDIAQLAAEVPTLAPLFRSIPSRTERLAFWEKIYNQHDRYVKYENQYVSMRCSGSGGTDEIEIRSQLSSFRFGLHIYLEPNRSASSVSNAVGLQGDPDALKKASFLLEEISQVSNPLVQQFFKSILKQLPPLSDEERVKIRNDEVTFQKNLETTKQRLLAVWAPELEPQALQRLYRDSIQLIRQRGLKDDFEESKPYEHETVYYVSIQNGRIHVFGDRDFSHFSLVVDVFKQNIELEGDLLPQNLAKIARALQYAASKVPIQPLKKFMNTLAEKIHTLN